MDYKCKKIPVDRLLSTSKGFVKPLCDTCSTYDCTNPIEKTKVSFIGINKEVKAFVVGDAYSFVVFCEGYTNDI